MIEKSLKQREQLEGYLRDTYSKEFLKYKANDFGYLDEEKGRKQ